MSTAILPAGWVLTQLGDVTRPLRPKVDPRSVPNMPFVGMEHVEAQTTRLLGTVAAGTMRSAGVEFRAGDVLYGRLRPYLNKVHRVAFDGVGSAEFIVLTGNSALDSSFLLHRLNAWDFVEFTSHLNEGDRPRVDWDQVKSFELLLPPIAEQRRIVAALEEYLADLDAAVAGLKRAKAATFRYLTAVVRDACEGRLRSIDAQTASGRGRDGRYAESISNRGGTAPDLEGIPSVPDGWVVASLDQLCGRITSGSRDWSRFYGRGSGTFIMARNVRPGRLDLSFRQAVDPPLEDRDRSRSQVQAGDVLVTIVGANTGDACLVPSALPEHYVCQSVALLRPVDSDIGAWLALYLSSRENGRRQFERYIYGAGRPHLSFDQLRMTAVLLPPPEARARILEEVERCRAVAERTANEIDVQLARAAQLRQAILKRAFDGKLVQQDARDEPASTLLARIRDQIEAGASASPRTRVARQRSTSRRGSN